MAKILYIPAENVDANVSRSYFVAKGLSKHHEVYRWYWLDNRNRFWQGKSPSAFYTFTCFFKSLFNSYRVEKAPDYGYFIHSPFFLNAFIGKLIGRYRAIKIMRKHNKKKLEKIVSRINPDIIFHADGFYFCPAINSGIPQFSDLQDDINWENIPTKCLQQEYMYYQTQFARTKKNFIVSENAAKNLNKKFKAHFIPFDNGADFETLRKFDKAKYLAFKKKNNIPLSKTIISYIGGAHKFDVLFAKKLTKHCKKVLPNVHFILAGNIPTIQSSNVTNLGFLSVDDANMMYGLSDIGITLKNTKNNDFLYNSVPLKFIQYGAAKKAIVSFPIKWSESRKFENIFHVNNENPDEWAKTFEQIINEFKWSEELEEKWNHFDWQSITNTLFNEIKSSLN